MTKGVQPAGPVYGNYCLTKNQNTNCLTHKKQIPYAPYHIQCRKIRIRENHFY